MTVACCITRPIPEVSADVCVQCLPALSRDQGVKNQVIRQLMLREKKGAQKRGPYGLQVSEFAKRKFAER